MAGFGAFTLCVAFIGSYNLLYRDVKQYPAACFASYALPKWYSKYVFLASDAVGGYISTGVYVWVMIEYRRHTKDVLQTASNTQAAMQLECQRRLTITFGILALFTFFLHSIPTTGVVLLQVFEVSRSMHRILMAIMANISKINSMVDIFVYLWRQKEIRKAMLSLICRVEGANVSSNQVAPNRSNPKQIFVQGGQQNEKKV